MNKAILMGRLTKDPEKKTTQNNISVCSFTVACDRRYKNANGQKETDFIPCVAWRGTADFISQYFKKGQRILVSGTIQPRSWDDPNGGGRRYITEVVCDEAHFVESRGADSNGGGNYNNAGGYGGSNNFNTNQSSNASNITPPTYQPDDSDASLPFEL